MVFEFLSERMFEKTEEKIIDISQAARSQHKPRQDC